MEATDNLKRGVEIILLEKRRHFIPSVAEGTEVEAGDIIGTVQETDVIEQNIMVPYGMKGVIAHS